MPRFSVAARVSAIVVIALVAFWIGSISLYYWSEDLVGEGGRPSAQQIAAIADLIERAPADERMPVLDAISSSILDARLEAGDAPGLKSSAAPSFDEKLRLDYATALGGRLIGISVLPRSLPRLFASGTNALEFRIRLRSGDTLVIDTKSRLVVSRLGLPPGFGAGLFGTLIALFVLIVMYREMRPVAQIAAAVDRIDPAGEPVRLPTSGIRAPELLALVQAFNRLQSRLAHLMRARMAMLGGISHDVRTFATRLRLRTDQISDPLERDRASIDIADMIRLLDDALLTSRAGAGELSEELVEFVEIVQVEAEDRRAAGSTIELRFSPAAIGTIVLGDRLALRRIVSNLFDNALKYGDAAHDSIVTDDQTITMVVDDEGTGIPYEMRDIILEPFARLEASRNRSTGGAGLGLAIVRNLVDAHDGAVAIGDAPTGGARFTVRLPIFKAV